LNERTVKEGSSHTSAQMYFLGSNKIFKIRRGYRGDKQENPEALFTRRKRAGGFCLIRKPVRKACQGWELLDARKREENYLEIAGPRKESRTETINLQV